MFHGIFFTGEIKTSHEHETVLICFADEFLPRLPASASDRRRGVRVDAAVQEEGEAAEARHRKPSRLHVRLNVEQKLS